MESIVTKPEQQNTLFENRFLKTGAESGKNKFWMYLLGIFAAATGYFLFQNIAIFPLIGIAQSHGITLNQILQDPGMLFNADIIGVNRSFMVGLLCGMFLFSSLFLWFVLKWSHKKPFISIITSYQKIRWGRFFFAFAVWGILIILLTVISYFTSPQEFEIQFNASKFMVLVIVTAIFIPIQTATEEFIFRGYLMQGFALVFKNGWLPIIITSILFGLMHASNPEAKTHGLLLMMPYYMLFGAFLGMLALLDEGLELSIGIHCANNLISSLLICSKNSALQTDAIFYSLTENPGAEFGAWIVMAAICFLILYKKYKLSNFKLLLK